MNELFATLIAEKLHISVKQAANTLTLIDERATIPFISRYRKERTGGLNEVQIAGIADEYKRLTELDKRKQTVIATIREQNILTDDLLSLINNTWSSLELEDIYMPFKPRRRTRAQIARERGLEPLAKMIMSMRLLNPESVAERFISADVPDVETALAGARDVIAEWLNEHATTRNIVRAIYTREAVITSRLIKGKEEEGDKYRDYFDFTEPLRRISSHRLLAIRRGESEGVLRVDISPINEQHVLDRLFKYYIHVDNAAAMQVRKAIIDSYKRLLKPSVETEYAASSKERADAEAIRIFRENLRQLLLSPPLGQKRVLSIDPGYRTGCKIVCLDEQGNLLHNETIYPHPPHNDRHLSIKKVVHLVEQFDIQAIAVGNGTAGRETEQFVQNIRYDRAVQIFSVSESGASIYSASKTAREEFPDYDVTVRGAISIGRRLLDPLAELVKIDPKSIGVGQYQHDVDQTALKDALDQTVLSCVNEVGVNLNTASRYLLTHVSGVGPVLAQNIVDYRKEHGAFRSRQAMMNVPKMGVKSFEQCAGFLRVPGADNPLDNSAVHPESYVIVERMAKDLHCSVPDLLNLPAGFQEKIKLSDYVTDSVGLPTLQDIVAELGKPGLDPRSSIKVLDFDPSLKSIKDLRPGMVLPGIVTNVTKFGCFVDMGLKENGLVHISEMADQFVSDPTAIVSLHQHITVKVLEIDEPRKRITLTMKKEEESLIEN
jgi:uncharacterized protein